MGSATRSGRADHGMNIIDAHVHLGHEEYLQLSVDALLSLMDEADATLAVVCPVDRDLAKPPGVWPRPATGPAPAAGAARKGYLPILHLGNAC